MQSPLLLQQSANSFRLIRKQICLVKLFAFRIIICPLVRASLLDIVGYFGSISRSFIRR